MDPQAKKVALRAINYRLYVLTAIDGDDVGAAGVNWLTQASFEPPLIAAAVRTDNDTHRLIERTGKFAVNVLGEDQLDIGKAFFRGATLERGTSSTVTASSRGERAARPSWSSCHTGSRQGSPTGSSAAITPCPWPR